MRARPLNQLSDAALERQLAAVAAESCESTAMVLAKVAEVDARGLYLSEGHASMLSYCVALGYCEDEALECVQAARAARQFPALFPAVAEGRLHLAAICLLAPHLTADNAEELIAAATHRRESEIVQLLEQRFPRPDEPETELTISPTEPRVP